MGLWGKGLFGSDETPEAKPQKPSEAKVAISSIRARTRSIAKLRFEDQKLKSFGGLVVFEKVFEVLELPR